jgi:hypothetical protein
VTGFDCRWPAEADDPILGNDSGTGNSGTNEMSGRKRANLNLSNGRAMASQAVSLNLMPRPR